jgi:hypothetical protein
VERYARTRAPAESGKKLSAPAWSALGPLLDANVAWRARQQLAILGRPLAELAAAARREIVDRAAQHVGESLRDSQIRVSEKLGNSSLIVTGHQPGLFHPGVWVKNFAAAELARRQGGMGVHVIIDADLCRSPTILVPGGTVDAPLATAVEFDAPAPHMPWEERRIADNRLWQSFPARVRDAAPLVAEPMLDSWWPTAVERGAATGLVGAALVQARHRTETEWGCRNLELPQSQLCQTSAFRWFACSLLADLPRFADAYNGALADYRRAHGVRNHAQPVPDLAADGPWCESPFWMWTAADPRRRPVFVRPTDGGVLVSDRGAVEKKLPLSQPGDASRAVEELAAWEAAGVKLRSRALVTTMFLRLAVADLFLHGIGGAKYDEATDEICKRFFGASPPAYATISGTLRLPIDHPPGTADDVRRLRHMLRELRFHPEGMIDMAALPPGEQKLAAAAAESKATWLKLPKTPIAAGLRHRGIGAANDALQEFLARDRARLQWELADATAQVRANRVLDSREYAFCLFPLALLEQFLLDFTAKAL